MGGMWVVERMRLVILEEKTSKREGGLGDGKEA